MPFCSLVYPRWEKYKAIQWSWKPSSLSLCNLNHLVLFVLLYHVLHPSSYDFYSLHLIYLWLFHSIIKLSKVNHIDKFLLISRFHLFSICNFSHLTFLVDHITLKRLMNLYVVFMRCYYSWDHPILCSIQQIITLLKALLFTNVTESGWIEVRTFTGIFLPRAWRDPLS